MWIKLLLMFAPDLEQLLNGVLGAATKTQQSSTTKMNSLIDQASQLTLEANQHKVKADQASVVLNKLQGILG